MIIAIIILKTWIGIRRFTASTQRAIVDDISLNDGRITRGIDQIMTIQLIRMSVKVISVRNV